MEIRKGLPEDYAPAMELIADFAEESLSEYGTYLDPAQLQKTFNAVYETSFVAVKDEKVIGILAGRIIEDLCSKRPVYEELVWYMHKKYRRYGIRLFYYIQSWCYLNNISRITMSCMHNSKTEKIFELYKKMGFRPMETRFIKELDNGG